MTTSLGTAGQVNCAKLAGHVLCAAARLEPSDAPVTIASSTTQRNVRTRCPPNGHAQSAVVDDVRRIPQAQIDSGTSSTIISLPADRGSSSCTASKRPLAHAVRDVPRLPQPPLRQRTPASRRRPYQPADALNSADAASPLGQVISDRRCARRWTRLGAIGSREADSFARKWVRRYTRATFQALESELPFYDVYQSRGLQFCSFAHSW
jgi:hypothetical protein